MVDVGSRACKHQGKLGCLPCVLYPTYASGPQGKGGKGRGTDEEQTLSWLAQLDLKARIGPRAADADVAADWPVGPRKRNLQPGDNEGAVSPFGGGGFARLDRPRSGR